MQHRKEPKTIHCLSLCFKIVGLYLWTLRGWCYRVWISSKQKYKNAKHKKYNYVQKGKPEKYIKIQKSRKVCPPRKSLQGPGHFPLPTKIPSEKTSFLDLHISSTFLMVWGEQNEIISTVSNICHFMAN